MKFALAFFALMSVAVFHETHGAGQETSKLRLENKFTLVEVTPEHGLISRIYDKVGKIELITEPRLSDNFSLLVPLPDFEGNYVLGKEQKLTSFEQHPDQLTLSWKGPLSNSQGQYDLDVVMRFSLIEEAVQVDLSIENRMQWEIAEVWYPILGGITGLGERENTREIINHFGRSTKTQIFHHFPNKGGGALGIPQAEVYWSYPLFMTMPWVDIYNEKRGRGLYFALHDPVSRYKVLRFELLPGLANRDGDNWPRPGQVPPELPVGMLAHWTLFPYVKKGETFQAAPAIIQFHQGDWHQGARLYRDWFSSAFQLADTSKNWMYDEMAFQDTMFLLPEGNVKWTFRDIPRWAGDALKYGVKSVLISGWNVGGHDGGYPDYTPDPRLGTWEELEQGIRECHKMGVKVFFFVNTQPVDTGTEWYKKELHPYRKLSKYGATLDYGWGMGSLGARLGFTRRPLRAMSTGIPEYRQIIVRHMEKLAQIGADGVHIDKLCPGFRTGALDFNPLLKMTPDRATSEGQLQSVKEIQEACTSINPDFAISAECTWDRLLEYSGVGWSWHWPAGEHDPVFKYTFPHHYLPTFSVQQPYDYTAVNNAIRYGYQVFVGPGNFTESMEYPPFRPLSRYIKEILRIRGIHKETIYQGEFLDTLEVDVKESDGVGYSVFRNTKTGKRACVIVNYEDVPRKASLISFQGNEAGAVSAYQPFEEVKSTKLPLSLELPAEGLAVVVEE